MTFVQVPSGQFMMGSLAGESQAARDEQPRHVVRITKPFQLGMFEVTQPEYEQLMGNDPSFFTVLTAAKFERRADLIVNRIECFNPFPTIRELISTEIAALHGVESVTPGLANVQTITELGTDPIVIQGIPADNRMSGEVIILQGECLAAKHQGRTPSSSVKTCADSQAETGGRGYDLRREVPYRRCLPEPRGFRKPHGFYAVGRFAENPREARDD